MNELETIQAILRFPTIHVVGLSPDPSRPSHGVARYLQSKGYRIVPVNPHAEEVLGVAAHRDLASAPGPVEVVNVFRRSRHVAGHVEEALAAGARAIWLQLGVIDEAAARRAEEAGLLMVMDRCIVIEHRRLATGGPEQPAAEAG